MSGNAVIPEEIKQLAQELADRQLGAMSIQLAELAALLAPARNVRPLPPQRMTAGYLAELGTTPVQIVGGRPDRAKVIVLNLDTTATDWVYVASSATECAQDSTSFPIVGASSVLSRVELTHQSDVWVRALTAATPIAWLVYDFDAG